MKKTKRRIRTSRRSIFLALLLPLAASFCAAQGKPAKQPPPFAVIAGTVFRDPGFAQRGATVVLTAKAAPKKTLDQLVSDSNGEFAFRVPAGPNTYVVTASLKGFTTARQEIEISGDERINATLLLIPESNSKGK